MTFFHTQQPGVTQAATLYGVTIDAPNALELDDAIWEEWDPTTGTHLLTIDVTRVSAHLRPRSEAVEEACRRGYTRYGRHHTRMMLPRWLCTGQGSLLPGSPRPVLAIQIVLDDASLEPLSVSIRQGTLCSASRLSFSEVASIIATGHTHPLHPMLARLADLAERLLARRTARGGLAVYNVASGWGVDEDGRVYQLEASARNVGYVIVQELMILANTMAAEWCRYVEVPVLFRNHQLRAPDPARLAASTALRAAIAAGSTLIEPAIPVEADRARYSVTCEGHYALQREAYMHLTSPLRRWADLASLWNIAAYLDGAGAVFSAAELERQGAALNAQLEEARTQTSAYHKQLAEQDARRRLTAAPASELAALDGAAFRRLFKVAALEPVPPDAFARAVALRAAAGGLQPRELFGLIGETPMVAAWQPLRLAALEWLGAHPCDAVTVLQLSPTLSGWSDVLYLTAEQAGLFGCAAALERLGLAVEGPWRWRRTKKDAQQAAALALCFLLCGEPPTDDAAIDAVSIRAPDAYALVRGDIEDAQSPVALLVAQDNLIGACHALADRVGWPPPDWQTSAAGTPQHQLFRCRATWAIPEAPIDVEGSGTSKQRARHAAALELYQALRRLVLDDVEPRPLGIAA